MKWPLLWLVTQGWGLLIPTSPQRDAPGVLARRHTVIGMPTTLEKDVYSMIGVLQRGDAVIRLPLPSSPVDPRRGAPAHHAYSRAHYMSYLASPYARTIPYADYCLLEDRLAAIVAAYLQDERRAWCILVDPVFLEPESIRSYEERRVIDQALWIAPDVRVLADGVYWPLRDLDWRRL